jgi:hypothetical protein
MSGSKRRKAKWRKNPVDIMTLDALILFPVTLKQWRWNR